MLVQYLINVKPLFVAYSPRPDEVMIVRYVQPLTDEQRELLEKTLLLSLGQQREQRGMRAQKVILRGPFARPPTPFAHSSAPSRCSCESHRSARPPLGSENTRRSSGAALPCGCLVLPGCCQRVH